MPFAVRTTFVAILAFGLMAQPALAQERALAFSLTTGAQVGPAYPGAGENSLRPMGALGLTGVQFGAFTRGQPDGPSAGPASLVPGTGIRGAFRMIAPRSGTGALAGMDDLGRAIELGLGLHHTRQNWQIYGEMRYGAIGHRGVAGALGANLIWRSETGQILHGGPRAEFGNARYARSYFGVTQAESARSATFAPYQPGGGLQSVGVELGAYQPLSPEWGIAGSLRFDRLRGDAALSPIVQQGSRAQLTSQIGLTRHFNLRF
jgi:MipA family protein